MNLHYFLLTGNAQEDEVATFSWKQTTYSTSLSLVWDGDPLTENYTGSYSDTFTDEVTYFNHSDNAYFEERRTVNYDANYSHFCNYTCSGYLNVDIDIEVYRVDVDYGSSVKLVWMALKKGDYDWDYYRDAYGYKYQYVEENHQIIDREIKKYNIDTNELIDSWNQTDEIYDTTNCSGKYHTPEGWYRHYKINTTFTMPFFLIFQLYSTEKGDHIAWASTFSEFLVFRDRNNDGIYTLGRPETPQYTGPLDIHSGAETNGWIRPIAREATYMLISPEMNSTTSGKFPNDRTVKEIASLIKFTRPSLVGNDTLVWGIDYNGFPMDMVIGRNDIPREQWIEDTTTPNDFSYGFDYKIGGGQADLSLTLDFPDLTHLDDYGIFEKYNLGLAIPKYNYFLSSFDIKEVNQKELSVPSDMFQFESHNDTVAEINLVNPLKKNYTLYDYPSSGESLITESRGSNVNNIFLLSNSYFGHLVNPELNFLYTIEDLAKVIPGFTIVDNLYHMHIENYPTWAGKRLIHDPTNIIYFENVTLPFRSSDVTPIPGFEMSIIFGSFGFAVLIITVKWKKLKKK
ncbi:MAG: hypothetical protein ACFFA3_16460 [Promethearchaeota archaeon]